MVREDHKVEEIISIKVTIEEVVILEKDNLVDFKIKVFRKAKTLRMTEEIFIKLTFSKEEMIMIIEETIKDSIISLIIEAIVTSKMILIREDNKKKYLQTHGLLITKNLKLVKISNLILRD